MARSIDKPVGHIALSGYGVSRAAGAVHWCLEYEGPQVVFIDADGRVFAFPGESTLAASWIARSENWFIGRYVRLRGKRRVSFAQMRAMIAEDIRDRLHELQQARAA